MSGELLGWLLVAWAAFFIVVFVALAVDFRRNGPSDLWDEPFGGEIR